MHDAIRAGAAGFPPKDAEPEELRRAVRVAAEGEASLSPSVIRRVMAAAATSPRPPARESLTGLTQRGREVLAEAGVGRFDGEIARTSHRSPDTARTHVGRLLAELGARDRAQFVVLAYETGLVTPGGHPSGEPGPAFTCRADALTWHPVEGTG